MGLTSLKNTYLLCICCGSISLSVSANGLTDIYQFTATQQDQRVVERHFSVLAANGMSNQTRPERVLQIRPKLVKSEQARVVSKQAGQVEVTDPTIQQDVINTVMAWVEHWSAKDVDGYLSHYADEFTPGRGISREKWAIQRKRLIQKPRFINIEIDETKVVFYGDEHAQVSFYQKYRSDSYSDLVKKTILMEFIDGRWLITEEKSD